MQINPIEQRVTDYIEAHQSELFALITGLVRFDSQNFVSDGREADCAKHVQKLYQELGLKTELYYPDALISGLPGYLSGRSTDKRPNVGGVYHGAKGGRRIMLAAHTDTMPIGDRSEWTVDPLGGEVKDGRIYGRGAGDDKFGIAVGVFLIQAFQSLGIRLEEDVVLSAYCDEEYGGGNGSFASCVKYPCDMYVNLDGGNSTREIWTAAVGGQVLRANIFAKEPQDSASLIVDGLTVVRNHVERFGARRRSELQRHRFYSDTDMQRSAMRILSFHCGEAGTELAKGHLEFVFYTVSETSEIQNEISAMEVAVTEELDSMGIAFSGFEPGSRRFDYICTDEDNPSIRLLLQCASEAEGHTIHPAGACLSDYFLYYKYGSKCSVTYGVFRDFKLYGGAHQPDEFIDCEELVNLTKALALFLLRWHG